MLWFHKIEMSNALLAVNECHLFSKVTLSVFKWLEIPNNKDLAEELAKTVINKHNRKDRFLLTFNYLLKHGCNGAVLPLKEIPNFGPRRDLFP